MSDVLDIVFKFYGIDWLGLLCGITGMQLITQKKRFGFLFSAVAGICGLTVASMGGQYGYVTYNAILFCLMLKGFYSWGLPKVIPNRISVWRQHERF